MSKRPAIVLFAYSEVGSVCLEELIKDGANVAAVYTHEDDPNEEIWFRSVRNIADENNIALIFPKGSFFSSTNNFFNSKPIPAILNS